MYDFDLRVQIIAGSLAVANLTGPISRLPVRHADRVKPFCQDSHIQLTDKGNNHRGVV